MIDQHSDLPLSSESLEILEALLRHSGALRRPDPAPPDIADMIRYLAGDLSKVDQYNIECGLKTHAASRTLLRQILPILRALQARSWQEVSQQALKPDVNGQVAQHWLELIASSARALPIAIKYGRLIDRATLRHEVEMGIQKARIAWGAFLVFGQQLKADLQRPRLALAKGSTAVSLSLEPSALQFPVSITLDAQITDDSDLVLELRTDLSEDQYAALVGLRVSVYLELNSETWPLGTVVLTESPTFLTVLRFGTDLNLLPGRLPSSLFKVTPEAPTSTRHEESAHLLADVCDASGHTSSSPLMLGIKTPYWDDGYLVIQVAIAETERKLLASSILELSLVLSPKQWQILGCWPVQDWTDTEQVLRVSCPGGPTSGLLPHAALRARLLALPAT